MDDISVRVLIATRATRMPAHCSVTFESFAELIELEEEFEVYVEEEQEEATAVEEHVVDLQSHMNSQETKSESLTVQSIVQASDSDEHQLALRDDVFDYVEPATPTDYQELLLQAESSTFIQIVDKAEAQSIDKESSTAAELYMDDSKLDELEVENAAAAAVAATSKKEIITYQRFGRSHRHQSTGNNFKCHLCGFSCFIKQTLLQHFRRVHPT